MDIEILILEHKKMPVFFGTDVRLACGERVQPFLFSSLESLKAHVIEHLYDRKLRFILTTFNEDLSTVNDIFYKSKLHRLNTFSIICEFSNSSKLCEQEYQRAIRAIDREVTIYQIEKTGLYSSDQTFHPTSYGTHLSWLG